MTAEPIPTSRPLTTPPTVDAPERTDLRVVELDHESRIVRNMLVATAVAIPAFVGFGSA